MGKIVLLDELTINQIAAGEVIERPASVIKEMVENSIDADANNITIEIKNGGISYIKITDNGKGIAKDDLEMAFERHATSKIRCAEDLNTVTSMGFRGEALASIAAISNVEMISKTEEQDVGYRVVVEAGNVLEKEETGCQVGTSIIVRNLFFNTPVRYKFLKKDYTETGYIEDVVTRIALVHPNIAFKLINAGKTIIQTSGNGDLKSVIYSIYGKDVAEGIIEVDYKYEDITVKGVIGKPEIARSNRSNQLFFVNKRHIKDKTLSAATEQAYKGMIPIGKFGFVVLNLELNPSKVDVNVHPAKLEVRFEEENKVFQSIYHAIKDALLKSDLVANTSKENENIDTDKEEIIIQNNDQIQTLSSINAYQEKPKSMGGLFSWKKNKDISSYTDEESRIKTNIIEDLYNKKKENEFPNMKDENEASQMKEEKKSSQIEEDNIKETFQIKEEEKEASQIQKEEKNEIDNPVDTSDVLIELKQMQEKIKNDIPKDSLSKANEDSEKVYDSSTYTYFGENKERIEGLLRQLHPNANKTNVNQDNEIISEEATAQNNEEVQATEQKNEANDIETIEQNNETNSINQIEQNNETENIDKDMQNAETEEIKQDSQNDKMEDTKQPEQNGETDTIKQPEQSGETEDTKQLEESSEPQLDGQATETIEEDNNEKQEPIDFNEMYEKLFGRSVINTQENVKQEDNKLNAVDIVKDNVSVFEEIEEYKKPAYKFIGIAFNTYIIVEIDKEMYIIDQHAAHERIMYEKVKTNYYSDANKDSQMLLLPDIITLSHKEMEIAKENMGMFNQAGFYLEEFGENTLKLIGVPTVCIDLDTKELFLETLDEINTVARTAKQEKEEKFIATVACKAAVKANMALTQDEVDSLMTKLLELPNPFTCPHGRPTAIKMTKYDIERKFARR